MMERHRLVLLGGLVLACFTGITLAGKGGGKPPKNDPPPDPAIAYMRSGTLTVANADGSNHTAVIETSGTGRASWSPDGTQLAFRSDIQGSGIYVVNVDGSGLRKVVSKNSSFRFSISWSPVATADGQYKLAFADTPNADGSGEPDIFVVNLDGTGLVNLTNTPDVHEYVPDWSSDASRLAVTEAWGPEGIRGDVVIYDIGLVNGVLAITDVFNLSSDADVPGGLLNGAYLTGPSWGRASDQIAVAVSSSQVNGSNRSDIWLIDLASPANPVNLTNDPDEDNHWACFSPDDTEVVFYEPRVPAGIFTLATDGSGARRTILKARNIGGPSWRRNP